MDTYSYIFSFIEGILTFISPCILPLLPVYFFYLAGISGETEVSAKSSIKRGKLIVNSIGFVIGFTIIFVILGAAATSLGLFLKEHIDVFRKVSGIIMVIFGLNFIGIIKFNILNTEKRFEYNFKEVGFFSSIVFGIIFGFGWSPCVGAFLGSALLMAGNADTVWQGITLLLVYSTGLGIPFIVVSVIFEKIRGSFALIRKYSRLISIVSGIVLIAAGILVFTDSLKYVSFI